MIIEVCSRSGALKLAAAAQVSTSVISITSKEEDALDCDRLIVHCQEGVSRSAAVAQAIYG